MFRCERRENLIVRLDRLTGEDEDHEESVGHSDVRILGSPFAVLADGIREEDSHVTHAGFLGSMFQVLVAWLLGVMVFNDLESVKFWGSY